MYRRLVIYVLLAAFLCASEVTTAQVSSVEHENEVVQSPSQLNPDSVPAKARTSFREALSDVALARGLPEAAAQRIRLLDVHPDYSGKQNLVIAYDLGWAEVAQRILVAALPTDGTNWEHLVASAVDWRLLDLTLPSRSRATALLISQCHPSLTVPILKAQPPFYNNVTNPSWFPDEEILLLEGSAVLDSKSNVCVTGSIDLVTGEVHCNINTACRVD